MRRSVSPSRRFVQPGERTASLASVLDAMEQGVIVYDACGELSLANVAMRELFASETEAARLQETLRELKRVLTHPGARDTGEDEVGEATRAMTVVLRTTANEYHLRAATLPHRVLGDAAAVVVTVHARAAARYWTSGELRERYALTPTESRVASLLEAGLPSREIARALEISLHTARRHVEAVLRKLGVHSRRAVHAKLARE